MITVLVVITAALLAIGVGGYLISKQQLAQQRRRARVKLLQQLVRLRYESRPDYKGDRLAYHTALEQVPAIFGDSGVVVAAFHRYRDAEVSASDSAVVQHHLTEMLRTMCRDVGIDPASVREELPLTSSAPGAH